MHRAPSKERPRNLFQATPGTSFQVGHSNNPNAQNRQWHIEKELVRLRPTTLSRKNQPVLHVFDFGMKSTQTTTPTRPTGLPAPAARAPCQPAQARNGNSPPVTRINGRRTPDVNGERTDASTARRAHGGGGGWPGASWIRDSVAERAESPVRSCSACRMCSRGGAWSVPRAVPLSRLCGRIFVSSAAWRLQRSGLQIRSKV